MNDDEPKLRYWIGCTTNPQWMAAFNERFRRLCDQKERATPRQKDAADER
jgi:hypothetical protein